jgi:hypothetical protein
MLGEVVVCQRHDRTLGHVRRLQSLPLKLPLGGDDRSPSRFDRRIAHCSDHRSLCLRRQQRQIAVWLAVVRKRVDGGVISPLLCWSSDSIIRLGEMRCCLFADRQLCWFDRASRGMADQLQF